MVSLLASAFGSSSAPKPKYPPPPKVDDDTLKNAGDAERIRRLKAMGKQQSIFAGELGPASVLSPTLG